VMCWVVLDRAAKIARRVGPIGGNHPLLFSHVEHIRARARARSPDARVISGRLRRVRPPDDRTRPQ
jgi:hypothetical protein